MLNLWGTGGRRGPVKLGPLLVVAYRTGRVTQVGQVSAGEPSESDKYRVGRFLSSLLTPLGEHTTKSKPGPPGWEFGMTLRALFFKNEVVEKRRNRCGNVYTYVGTGLR